MRAEKADFFTTFSRQHDGWLVTVEMMGPEIGAQVQGRELPLRGVSTTASRQGSGIVFTFEALDGDHLTHIVSMPDHVWVQQTSHGADAALQIQSVDGTSMLVRFRSAVRPETVDGMMPAVDRHR